MSFVPARCPSCSALILIERIQRIWAIELLKRSLHWVCTLSGFLLAAWNAALQAPAWHGPPVWIHGDLLPGNLLVHSGRITAVIDFACLGVGDPACDLILAWALLSADTRDIFRAALFADDAMWAKGRGWALSIGLIAPLLSTQQPSVCSFSPKDHRRIPRGLGLAPQIRRRRSL
jgi:hypothetical protein